MISSHHKGIPICAIDAFSANPMGGNGATVVLLDHPASSIWMQALAAELAQSETSFLWHNGGQWCLRWFTPTCEVSLCGHATLAAGLALHKWGELAIAKPIDFQTRSGKLRVEVLTPELASIDLPSEEMKERQTENWIANLLGADPLATWSSQLGYGVILVNAEFPIASLDCNDLAWQNGPEKAWLVMQTATQPYQYQLRFFAPNMGIKEDPVTGSAHALVAPWWCKKLGINQVQGWQPSQRPGGMFCEPIAAAKVRIKGNGVILWQGYLPWQSSAIEPDSWIFTSS
ncbi:PhzF family phenazine biosynthesis protein [Synechococcus lacustris]|uniref:PhzF family phenazine biosynthesis protein n=1 Tax=Synechococcus lacustris TaxID=2116544 RepID=UPI0020CB755B|nr:PhzF family phenazine biosynthesis protein [Synechococcus lacustris]MCP9811157.1 PhzF family phenazine biosynthesis protein [Synechococcus lacustris Maggiore-St4-Slac]